MIAQVHTGYGEIYTCYITIQGWPMNSHERYGTSNHRQIDSLFNSLFRLSIKKRTLRITVTSSWKRPQYKNSLLKRLKTWLQKMCET